MLNEKNERELAYVVKVTDIQTIPGADRIEVACINGWRSVVQKNDFKPGDLAIFFEIDSKVPAEEPYLFLKQKHFKIKTQKYMKGTVLSQGLLMPLEEYPDLFVKGPQGVWAYKENPVREVKENDFLTNLLHVTYSDASDTNRKAKSEDRYKLMAQRKPNIFKKPFIRKLMQYEMGRRLLFLLFGKKKDKKKEWPEWVSKTDEERVQNMPWILEDKTPWVATEKIDGTSTTFTYKIGKTARKDVFYVCSRNVVFDRPEKNEKCYYDTNMYLEMAEKYDVKRVLKALADRYNLKWVTLQGETFGGNIQNRDYSRKDYDFRGFNLIFSNTGRLDSVQAKKIMEEYHIPWVPIVDTNFILPDTVEELLELATGKSQIDGEMREGLVFRSPDGQRSFKAVSNEFLMKYHN